MCRLFVRLFVLNSSRSLLTTTLTGDSRPRGRDAYCISAAFKSLSNSKLSIFNEAWYSASEKWESANSRESSTFAPCNEPIREGSDWDNNREDDSAIEFLDCDGDPQLWWNHKEHRADTEDDAHPEMPVEPDSSDFCYKAGRMMMLIGELLYLLRPIVCVIALRQSPIALL